MKQIILAFILVFAKVGILTPIRVARLKFWYKLHKWPNFEHPKDLNEKINWMKFYGDTSLWPMLADKYAVRKYACDQYKYFNYIDQQFVMKCNNGSGDVMVCKDKSKLDIEAAKRHFEKCLKEKLSILSGEPHYAKIKPCVIAENLLDASTQPCNSSSLVDYKIWVFDGKPIYTWCAWNREKYHANVACYDMDWQFHPEWLVWTDHYVQPKTHIPKPQCFDKLMDAASKLAEGQPVARIDMYVCKDKVFFGEITMTSQGGYMDNYTPEFLERMGEMTLLPINQNRNE